MGERGNLNFGVVFPFDATDTSGQALAEAPDLFYSDSKLQPYLVALPPEINGVKLVAGMRLSGTGDFSAEYGSQVKPAKLHLLAAELEVPTTSGEF